ncbi:MAG: Xaa-Pro aminopeptidase [Balneolaceae bacterium]|nr:Xaa-Pro aminopeptidase [Balneolaceae bacterium]
MNLPAQDKLFQQDFEWSVFEERRSRVVDSIGPGSIVLLQGGFAEPAFRQFRQTNEFYYLTGLEIPHAYLLLNGATSTLYIPHRDESKERSEGKKLAAEDAGFIIETTGIDRVYGLEMLSKHLSRRAIAYPVPDLYTLFSPGEGPQVSRDVALVGEAQIYADPWSGVSSSQTGRFIGLIESRFPQFTIHDLSPILDNMRIIKGPQEIELIRKASRIAGVALMDAMKSTNPGIYEYQLEAVADFHYKMSDSDEGYSAIVGGGQNAWHGHYFKNQDPLKSGDLVLMDYAPDYRYYTSDLARIWPVNGEFSPAQKELYSVIVAYHKELLPRIRSGVTKYQILEETSRAMRPVIEKMTFSKPIYRKAAEGILESGAALSHPVGMSVHDVGEYQRYKLQPGMVFSVDPMIWVPEEKLYIRAEDTGVVTESGFDNFSGFLPLEIADIESLMRKKGIIQMIDSEYSPLELDSPRFTE